MLNSSGLQASQLHFAIDGKVILSDIQLSLAPGKVLALVGPNGAGKTTLLKLLSGQTTVKSMVSWHGKHLELYHPKEKARQIAVVNQLHDMVFALNLRQIVEMGLLPHQHLFSRHTAKDSQTVSDAITRVGLDAQAEQSFSSLSGGEQQRGLIARALVQKASLLILDEPVNHLDVYYQHQILGLLNSLAHQHQLTVVMSLHDLNLAANYCDQICLLQHGKILAQGSPEQVIRADLLQQLFQLPAQVHKDKLTGALRVEFSPPSFTTQQPKNAALCDETAKVKCG